MDAAEIVKNLTFALNKGAGSLDDLEDLLDAVKKDIQKEREAQERAKLERSNYIAQMATRLVNDEFTDDDCAFVINEWGRQNGCKLKVFAKDLRQILTDDKAKCAPKCATKNEDPSLKNIDEIIDSFLKSFNLK